MVCLSIAWCRWMESTCRVLLMSKRQVLWKALAMWWNWSLFTDLKVCSFGNLISFKGKRINYGRHEGHPACKKTEWWGAGVVICLERGADLHMVQLMPLPLTVSCFSKIQIDLFVIIMVPADPGSPGKQQQQRPFNGLWSGTTRVGRYQKKHSPTHTHPGKRAIKWVCVCVCGRE